MRLLDLPKSHINPMESSLKNSRQRICPSIAPGACAAGLTILTKPRFTSHRHEPYLTQTFHKYLLSLYYMPGTKYCKCNGKQDVVPDCKGFQVQWEDGQRQHRIYGAMGNNGKQWNEPRNLSSNSVSHYSSSLRFFWQATFSLWASH